MDFKAMMQAEREKARRATETAPPSYTLSARQRGALTRVPGTPSTVWHLRDFVSEAEELALLQEVDRSPATMWTPLGGRRLQSLGGLPKAGGMSPVPLPAWVQSISAALIAAGAFAPDSPPNHVLLNEYQPGQGIEAHRDGPLYLDRVAILSLGSVAGFDFLDDDRSPLASLLLPPRGVLSFAGDAYTRLLHQVPATRQDAAPCDGRPLIRLDAPAGARTGDEPPPEPPARRRRVSLTFRRVLQVHDEGVEPAAPPLPLWEERRALAKWLGEG